MPRCRNHGHYDSALKFYRLLPKESGAVNNLGYMYENGMGVPTDLVKAFELYKEAAEMGDDHSMRVLAAKYYHGEGCAKDVAMAMAILKNTNKAASEPVAKLLKSAMANAENNFGMNKDALVVKECYANAGPILKRIMPRAQGRAFRINKRTSHVTIVLEEKEA